MFEVSGSAVIPTGTYQNIQPSFTATGETLDEARKNWLREMWKFHRMVGKSLDVSVGDSVPVPKGKVLTCWASGTEVVFEAESHTYGTADGKAWLSGSVFADRFTSDFDDELIAGKSAAKHGVEASDLLAMWALNKEASALFGSSLHAALQLRGEYAQLSRSVKDGGLDAALTKNPVLRPIVEAFFESRDDECAAYEAFVADPVLRHCGQIDRIVNEPDGLIVEDFKTNADLLKRETIKSPFKGVVESNKLGAYWLQLSFYARILESHGKHVKGLRVHHWTGDEWVTYSGRIIDLSEGLDGL